MKLVIVLCALFALTYGNRGFGPGRQDWAFETVRPGAHLFWWLYYTTANVTNYTDRPLVIWLQGGPGGSSTGFGNFAELGPLDLDLNERNYTWVRDVNVLFVDNPVGTGFSYVDNKTLLTTTNRQIADDFLVLLRGFYNRLPEFRSVPLYILSESYGGKMAAEIGLVLDQAIRAGSIESNFIGVGLGDAWVSPIDSVLNWGPYLWNVGAVNQQGYAAINEAANITKQLLDNGLYYESTDQWRRTQYVVMEVSAYVNFYNILTKIKSRGSFVKYIDEGIPIAEPGVRSLDDVKLAGIMEQVRVALGLNVTWGAQRSEVFRTLEGDFMKPVTNIVEQLLNTTNITVAVFSGQLDLICCTPGTVDWVDNLIWTRSNEWPLARRTAYSVAGINEGYEQVVGKLGMYWVNRAGHMVPSDNPAAMDYILRQITDNYNGTATRQ